MADDALDNVTEVEVTASRKRMLDEYEPISEHVTFTATIDDGDDPMDVVEDLREEAFTEVEQGVADRYEAYVREQAFGDD